MARPILRPMLIPSPVHPPLRFLYLPLVTPPIFLGFDCRSIKYAGHIAMWRVHACMFTNALPYALG